MARIAKEFVTQYPSISFQELKRPMIFVVDMNNGFLKEGALHDSGMLACVKPIETLLQQEVSSIFFTDKHRKDALEFQSYPPHCIEDTSECEIIEELAPYVKKRIEKHSTNAFVSEGFQKFLMDDFEKYDDYVITGCCTDICILQFAMTLQAYLNEFKSKEKRILVPINGVDTYHSDVHDASDWNEFAINYMKTNGIHVVSCIA